MRCGKPACIDGEICLNIPIVRPPVLAPLIRHKLRRTARILRTIRCPDCEKFATLHHHHHDRPCRHIDNLSSSSEEDSSSSSESVESCDSVGFSGSTEVSHLTSNKARSDMKCDKYCECIKDVHTGKVRCRCSKFNCRRCSSHPNAVETTVIRKVTTDCLNNPCPPNCQCWRCTSGPTQTETIFTKYRNNGYTPFHFSSTDNGKDSIVFDRSIDLDAPVGWGKSGCGCRGPCNCGRRCHRCNNHPCTCH